MVVDQRCADEILTQLSAVKAALNQVAANLIESEMNACVSHCMPSDTDSRLERIGNALSSLLRCS